MLPALRPITSRFSLLVVGLVGLTLVAASAVAGSPTRFTATVTGTGSDVLLIPGLACPGSVWDATAARLKETHRVHILQVAGFAGAPAAGNADGPVVGPLVDEIAAYIEAQKLKAPAVIGHSLGGFSALALAARHPALVGRVMAVDSAPFFPALMNPSATTESARPGADALRDQISRLPAAAFGATQAPILERMIKDPAQRAALLPVIGKSDPGVVARAMHDLLTTDLRPELAAITAPVTVLYAHDEAQGAAGTAASAQMETAYANVKAVRVIRVDGSLHFIMLDQPEKFAAAVDEFLR